MDVGKNHGTGQPESDLEQGKSVVDQFAADDLPAIGEPPRGKELRRSLRFVTAAWFFGAIWQTLLSGAPITLFAKSLGATEFDFGLLSAMPFIGALLASPTTFFIDKTGKRKLIFFLGLYTQRLLWIPIGILPLFILRHWGASAQPVALFTFLVLVLFQYIGGSAGGPAWMSWMADLIPDRARGRYIGRRRTFGMLTLIPTAIVSGLILDRIFPHDKPVNSIDAVKVCGWLFIVATSIGLVDIILHHFAQDVRVAPHKSSLFGIFARPLRDPQFLWFAGFVGTIYFAVSFMGQFSTLYLLEKLDASYTQTQIIVLAVPSLAQMLVLAGWGHAVDRLGKRPVMAIAALGLVPVGIGWCFMNSGAIWLGYILTAAGAALYCGVEVANFNMLLEMAGTDDEHGTAGSSYVAVNAIIVNVCGCLGGLSAGFIAQSLRNWTYDLHIPGLARISFYEVLFALSAVMRLLAVVVFLPRIHEPHAKPAAHVVRFMTANIYNNLFSLVSLPLKVIRRDEDYTVPARRVRNETTDSSSG